MSITEIEEGTSQTEEESDLPEWESHYFSEESSTGSGGRKRGTWKKVLDFDFYTL